MCIIHLNVHKTLKLLLQCLFWITFAKNAYQTNYLSAQLKHYYNITYIFTFSNYNKLPLLRVFMRWPDSVGFSVFWLIQKQLKYKERTYCSYYRSNKKFSIIQQITNEWKRKKRLQFYLKMIILVYLKPKNFL